MADLCVGLGMLTLIHLVGAAPFGRRSVLGFLANNVSFTAAPATVFSLGEYSWYVIYCVSHAYVGLSFAHQSALLHT